MHRGQVQIELGKGGDHLALPALEQRLLLDPVCLQVVFKVGPLGNKFSTDRALVSKVVGEGNSATLSGIPFTAKRDNLLTVVTA